MIDETHDEVHFLASNYTWKFVPIPSRKKIVVGFMLLKLDLVMKLSTSKLNWWPKDIHKFIYT